MARFVLLVGLLGSAVLLVVVAPGLVGELLQLVEVDLH